MYNVHPRFRPKHSGKKSAVLIVYFNYLYLETKLIIVFQGIILHMDIIEISINKRIKNIYIDTDLVLPIYNAHPYFPPQNLSKKCLLYMTKYGSLIGKSLAGFQIKFYCIFLPLTLLIQNVHIIGFVQL